MTSGFKIKSQLLASICRLFPSKLIFSQLSTVASLSNNNSDGKEKVCSHCFKLYHAYSISSNVGEFFFQELNSKGLYQSLEKENKGHCLVLTSSTKHEHITQFHVFVAKWRQRKVQKGAMHMQSCCFAYLNPLLFCRHCCHQ